MDNNIEEKWSKLWYENHVFEPEIDEGIEKFFVTVPWPYTNGSLHVGHGRTYTLGDIIARYKRLRGYNVLFPMGFHESGTPILAFSERLRNNDINTIKLYKSYLSEYEKPEDMNGILEKFKEPENIADYFARVIIKDFKNLGYSIDWTRSFTSADKFYQEIVKWQFRKLESLGLLKKGEYPILYSINDENAVGEDDIKDGDTDKVSIEEFTGVVFKGKNYNLMAASLRPETLYGVTNLWINPEARYVLIGYKNDKYVMSYEGYLKFSFQHENVKLISDVSNNDILNQKFKVPLYGICVSVISASFVDPDNGTGVVYSVPGHSIFDYIYFKNNNIKNEIKNVVKTNSDINVENLVKKYDLFNNDSKLKEATQELYKEEFYNGILINSGKYSNLSVQEARELIKNDLLKDNNAMIFYETTRKAITRSGSKVIVAILKDQWFIDYSQKWLKEKSHDLINSMKFYPELYRKAMNDAIDWLRERPAARKRGIGTKLPFDENWIIESLSDSTIYMVAYTNRNELYNIYNHLNNINDDILDHIFLNKNLKNKYDDYTMENIVKAKNEFDYWYGNDLRITAPPHISNHLSFYIMNHAAIFSGKYLPGGLMVSGLVISNGAKISKSKGNVISLLETVKKYSADIYRLFIAVGADISSLLDWNEKDLTSIIKKQSMFLSIFENYSDNSDDNNYIYKWFYSSFYKNLKDYFTNMESMDIRDAYISIFYNVLNDLKYVENRGFNINKALKMVMHDWLIALSPVMPYSCEELWHKYVKDSFVSKEYLDFNIDDKIDYNILRSEEYLSRVLSDIREILKIIKYPGKIINLTVYGDIQKNFIENFNNKTLKKEYNMMIKDYMKNKNRIDNNFLDEYYILNENREFIEKSLNMKINIIQCNEILLKNPWPGRPLIRIE